MLCAIYLVNASDTQQWGCWGNVDSAWQRLDWLLGGTAGSFSLSRPISCPSILMQAVGS